MKLRFFQPQRMHQVCRPPTRPLGTSTSCDIFEPFGWEVFKTDDVWQLVVFFCLGFPVGVLVEVPEVVNDPAQYISSNYRKHQILAAHKWPRSPLWTLPTAETGWNGQVLQNHPAASSATAKPQGLVWHHLKTSPNISIRHSFPQKDPNIKYYIVSQPCPHPILDHLGMIFIGLLSKIKLLYHTIF